MKVVSLLILLAVLLTLAATGPAGAIRIYLNPSDQIYNVSPDGTYNEAYAMQDVARRLATKLMNRGFEVQNSNGASMSTACAAANAWPADRFISLHTNAGSGGWGTSHGTMGFYYQSSTGYYNPYSRDIADRCVHKCVQKFSAWGRGYDIGTFADYAYYGWNLYVLKNTNMPGTLVEGLYHDNYDDLQVLKSDAGKDAYAQAVYEAVCDHYGLPYALDYVGMARTPGNGYWITAKDGAIYSYGGAQYYGGANSFTHYPIVQVCSTSDGGGYWEVASDGGIFTYGNAPFKGSLGGITLNAPIVGMARTPSNQGYWLVGADGGIFCFGDAPFKGSLGGIRLNKPIVGMCATTTGQGYWLVASDGGVFCFGDAPFKGSLGSIKLNAPIVGMASTPTNQGYWLVGSDGGVFCFGDAPFKGSMGGQYLAAPIVGMCSTASGQGYWLLAKDAGLFCFGDAPYSGHP